MWTAAPASAEATAGRQAVPPWRETEARTTNAIPVSTGDAPAC